MLLFLSEGIKTYTKANSYKSIDKNYTNKEKGDGMEKVLLVGVGGAGCHSTNRLRRSGVSNCEYLAIDTDVEQLGMVHKNTKKLLIGKASLHGKGAGGYPSHGAEAAKRAKKALEKAIGKRELVFLFTGMGGGTGTGVAPVVAEIAKKHGALTIAFATIPFKLERARRMKTNDGLKALAKSADAVLLMENDCLVKLVPNLPISHAFAVIDELVAKAVKGCMSVHDGKLLTGVDANEFVEMFSNAGFGYLSWGEGKGSDKVNVAAKGVAKNFFFGSERPRAKRAFVDVLIGKNGTLGEAMQAGEDAIKATNADSTKFAARIGETGDDTLEISVLATGVPAPDFSVLEQYNKQFLAVVAEGELEKITRAIVRDHANVNVRDKLGAQPIHSAAFKGNLEVAKLLVKKGADVNARGPGGSTPISFAARMAHAKLKGADYEGLVRFLIEKGADVNAKNTSGCSPLHFAKNKKVAELLRKAGARKR